MVGGLGFGLVGLHIEGVLAGEFFTISPGSSSLFRVSKVQISKPQKHLFNTPCN